MDITLEYKAFISYSHAADGELAPWLQQGLHKFAKPWYRLRALRLFRDKTSLALTPKLWPTIKQALKDSENFILLASPEAAASRWVQQEVDYWITHRSSESFFIVLTEGHLQWDLDGNDFNWSKTDALPTNLKGYFRAEPFFLDLRWARTEMHLSLRQPTMQDAIADLAAPLHRLPKDKLVGADIREHHRTMRLAWGVGVVLFLFAVFTGLAAFYANRQRMEAEKFARNSIGRAVAAQSETYLASKPERSLLLAVEAVEATRIEDALVLPAAEEALRKAVDNLGGSISLKKHNGEVKSGVFSPDGAWVATAGSDGTVNLWHSERGPTETFILKVSPDGVHRVSFSPDSRRMLAVGGGLAKIWDLAGLGNVPLFESPPDEDVTLAAFIGGGDLLALASAEGELRLVRLEDTHAATSQSYALGGSPDALITTPSGDALIIGTTQGQVLVSSPWDMDAKPEILYEVGRETITTLAISGNGRWLFIGHLEGRSVVIDRDAVPPKEKVLMVSPQDLEGFQSPPGTDPFGDVSAAVQQAAFDADGRYVAAGMLDGTVRVWDLIDVAMNPLELQAHDDTILQVAFGPDAKWLMTSGRDGQTRFFSMPDGKGIFTMPHRHEAPVDIVALNSTWTRLLTADRSGRTRLWWLEPDGQEPRKIPGMRGRPEAAVVAFDARRKRVAWATREPDTFVITRLLSGGEPAVLGKSVRDMTIAVSDDGRYLAASGVDPQVYLWDLARMGAKPVVFTGHSPAVFSLAFSSDGQWLASGSGDRTARIWRVNGTKLDAEVVMPHGSPVGALAFDPSGKLLATGDWSPTLRVWSVPEGTLVLEDELTAEGTVRQVLFTPDGRWLIACAGKTVWVHALEKGGKKYRLPGHTDMVTCLAVDASSQWFASGGWDGSVLLWGWDNAGWNKHALRGHVGNPSDIAFSPDGTRLATTDGSAGVLVWDVTSPETPPVRLNTPGPVAAVAFGSEGQKAYAVTKKGGVVIWDLNVENLVDLGCRLAGRALSSEEWNQFFPGQPYSPRCLVQKRAAR